MSENKWKLACVPPEDDDTVLVIWMDSEKYWKGPYRAYYIPEERRFFPIDSDNSIPINVDMWIEMPEMPQ